MRPYAFDQVAGSGKLWNEFLRSSDLSAGVYRLPAGAADLQKPHTEDEIYYVVAGRSRFVSGDSEIDAAPGSILFVPAGEPHRFFDITEELQLLVFFAPAEGSR